MITAKQKKIIALLKELCGSIMSQDDILTQYSTLTPAKKKYLYSECQEKIKKLKIPFDQGHPLLAVELGVLSYENNVDAAVILLCFLQKGK